MASEFAVSEVFSSRKKHTAKMSRIVALQSTDQLQDHDDAFSEAQTILSDWMNKKLRLELEVDEDEEEKEDEEEQIEEQPAHSNYKNFNGIYSQLAAEDESFEVRHFLQDLMEKDVMHSEVAQGLWLDADDEKKRGRDPNVTMEVRHQQVKERRAQREAERERRLREQEAQKEALAEFKRLECEEQRKREKEAQRQEALLQQEVVRLRRLVREKRSTEQQGRKRDQEKLENQDSTKNTVTPKPGFVTQRQLRHREAEVEARVCTLNLQCTHKHFSAWYSLVLERRMRLGKAAALCDWRRQLRAWRAWRDLVWERRKEKEAERMEEELRQENRRRQLAQESDRRRLLRRCLGDWRLWCRMERERRELLSQQEETRRKMTALIDAAASGKLTTKNCTEPPITAPQTESLNRAGDATQLAQVPVQRAASAPSTPTQAWQVTRRHAAASPAEAREGQKLSGAPRCQSAEMRGGRYDHRHLAQQRTIAEQKRRLKEQQDVIAELQERQKILELRQEAEKAEQLAVRLKLFPSQNVFKTSHGSKGESGAGRPAPKEHDGQPAAAHSSLRAMEERARQRAERRRELEEMKRKREEEKRAQMKAEEEERQKQERIEAERKKEEWRKKKERETEKQRRAELEQKLLKQAGEHYLRSLLLYRGITPWKRLVKQSHANDQKAEVHRTQALQRRCFLRWRHTTDEALVKKKSHADQLYERILLQRALSRWKMFKLLQSHLEVQAEHFHAIQTQRKVLKVLLDYAMQQRLEGWDKEQRADEYSARREVSRCFAAWRRLPATLQEHREREDRREQLRRKVSEILPDFRPAPVDDVWSSASHV
ncbi:coiled-coil domain-containing protein [Clarias magur]|uniref:Coiled-coil domain-containing protein n=1 Tax=Clarias magur TaxID=1594786 RepID=A0A8J4X3R9_CLAMG|nr:coiled-coil domain-containing protein [Clarias magur]